MEFIEETEEYSANIEILRCIKCGSKSNLIPFKFYTQFGNVKVHSTHRKNCNSVIVPTCKQCNHQFNRWKLFKINYFIKSIEICILTALLCTILYILFSFMFFFALFHLLLGISLLILGTGIVISSWFRLNQSLKETEDNPNRYMQFSINNLFFIKPEHVNFWLDYRVWAYRILQDKYYAIDYTNNSSCMINDPGNYKFFKCENCGVKVNTQELSCWNCGKFIPLI